MISGILILSVTLLSGELMKYESEITSAAKEYRVNPAIIKAIISVESSWNPNATRYEKHIDDTSYGLMQILTKTAKWITGNKDLTKEQLQDPTLNIIIGTRYYKYLLNKYKDQDSAIASYNAGSPKRSKLRPTKFVNQGYVDKVKKALFFYQKKEMLIIVGAGSIGFLLMKYKKVF